MKMIILKFLGYFLLAAVSLLLYVRFYEAKLLFLPSQKLQVTPRDVGLDFSDITFTASDRTALNGWLIKAAPDAATVLFFHGNAGNIGNRLDKIAILYKMGLNVFIIDYRGYGKSQGHPSEAGIYLDAQASYEYLKGRKDIAGEKILLYGESVGCAVAVDLAEKYPVKGLIAEGAFSSARDMAKVILPFVPSAFVRVQLDSERKIRQVKVPKLFIHSRYDEVVPFRLAQKLFNAAPDPKEFLEIDGDHNEGYALSYKIYTEGIRVFLQKYKLLD